MQDRGLEQLIKHIKKDFEKAKSKDKGIILFIHKKNKSNIKVLSKTEQLKYGLEPLKNGIQKTILSEPYIITNKEIKWGDFKELLAELISKYIYIEQIKPGQ